MEILEKLFGSALKIKLMRLFIFNADEAYTIDDSAKRTKGNKGQVRREMNILEKAKLVRRKNFYKEIKKTGRKGSSKVVYKKVSGFTLNRNFTYISALQNLLLDISPMTINRILHRLRKYGRIKLVIAAGIFVQDHENRIDLLIVGDRLNRSAIDQVMRGVEAEIGKELKYALLDGPDFSYRMGVCDKLVRDVFDYPHKILVDLIGVK